MAKLKAPGARQPKPIPEAIEAFHTSVGNLALATRTKYQRVLRFFSTVGPPPLALPILPHNAGSRRPDGREKRRNRPVMLPSRGSAHHRGLN